MPQSERSDELDKRAAFGAGKPEATQDVSDTAWACVTQGVPVILQGPPGTGKTRLVWEIKKRLETENLLGLFRFIQFHRQYTYEDFIEGFRVKEGGLGFDQSPGHFRQFCQQALETKGRSDKTIDL